MSDPTQPTGSTRRSEPSRTSESSRTGEPTMPSGPVEPPPYAWLDDPAQPFGPVGITTTFAVAAALAAVGLFGVVTGVVGGPDARAARLGVGIVMLVLGAVVARTGTARRAWRRRHPGVDPLAAAREAGADVGSALGGGSRTGRVGRWVLVVVCALVALVAALAVRRAVTGETPTSTGGLVVIVLLGLLALGTAGMTLVAARRRGR